MNKICYLICAGESCPLDFTPKTDDLVIAVDGGLRCLERAGIMPNLCVGDFDSFGRVPDGNIIRLDPIKDESDLFAAVNAALKRGYKHFKIYCALGGRLSHTLANINILSYIHANGGDGEIIGNGTRAFLCFDKSLLPEGGYMSLLPVTDEAEVEISGCKYSGTFRLTTSDTVGISNEPQKNAAVVVHNGGVLIVLEEFDY